MSFYLIIRGPLGCGKSTISEIIAQRIKAELISIDKIVDKYKLDKEREQGYISQKSFLKANEKIIPPSLKSLKKNIPIIFDGNFYWKSQIEDLIQRLNFPRHVFTLRAPLEVCIERDLQRRSPHGADAVRAVYAKAIEFDYGTIIDATKPTEECVNDILTFLGM